MSASAKPTSVLGGELATTNMCDMIDHQVCDPREGRTERPQTRHRRHMVPGEISQEYP